jgi:hypothetical protein
VTILALSFYISLWRKGAEDKLLLLAPFLAGRLELGWIRKSIFLFSDTRNLNLFHEML